MLVIHIFKNFFKKTLLSENRSDRKVEEKPTENKKVIFPISFLKKPHFLNFR